MAMVTVMAMGNKFSQIINYITLTLTKEAVQI